MSLSWHILTIQKRYQGKAPKNVGSFEKVHEARQTQLYAFKKKKPQSEEGPNGTVCRSETDETEWDAEVEKLLDLHVLKEDSMRKKWLPQQLLP